MKPFRLLRSMTFAVGLAFAIANAAAETNTFVVAAYNLYNWLAMPRGGEDDMPKPPAEKDALIKIIAQIAPDIIGLSEIGGTNDLAEVRQLLADNGLVYPHSEWTGGPDPVRHLALLSRFPITERHSRGDYTYTIGTNVFGISRGILDVTIAVTPEYSFRTTLVHFKSRRRVPDGDQALMRLEEARLLRGHIGKILKANPDTNLLVLGDLNDDPGTPPIRLVIGEEPFHLVDLLPVDSAGNKWTHLWFARRETSRIDYLLASQGLRPEFVPGSAGIADFEGWETASDHRAIYARFHASERPPAGAAPADPAAEPPAPDAAPPGEFLGPLTAVLIVMGLVIVVVLLRRRRH